MPCACMVSVTAPSEPNALISLARVAASSSPGRRAAVAALDLAGVCLAAPREAVSGDAWSAVVDGPRAHLVMADGLGHGSDAARAADAAIDTFERAPEADPAGLLERIHAALRGLRGAAVVLLDCDAGHGQLTLHGAGNIAVRLVSGTEERSLMTPHGTVGLQIRRAPVQQQAWGEHALVIVHSDGIATRWTLADTPALLRCPAVVVAAWILHMHMRGRDDATVVVLRRC